MGWYLGHNMRFCTFFQIFHVHLGEKIKNVSFYMGVCLCKGKTNIVSLVSEKLKSYIFPTPWTPGMRLIFWICYPRVNPPMVGPMRNSLKCRYCRYRLGRVDSIRASHPEASDWCQAMDRVRESYKDKAKMSMEARSRFEVAMKKQTKVRS